MSWTKRRIEALKILWAEGNSATKVAHALGNTTRNAVIGKVHRLGISDRKKLRENLIEEALKKGRSNTGANDKPVSAASLSKAEKKAVTSMFPLPVEAGKAATVLTLRGSMCKWPIGDPEDRRFAFCGRKATRGPYCTQHAKLAFQTNKKRERSSEGELVEESRKTA